MNITTPCTCPLCRQSSYDPSQYIVDIKAFGLPRPNGVSGLMRVKDEEEFVAASIDSCIDALDELVICYQQCNDNTPQILELKRQQYPDKIKLYFYEPYVYAHNLSPQEYSYAYNLPDSSIHLLCNYYNYTLSKAKYSYAMKIDADQIYFSERLKKLCQAYRSSTDTPAPTALEQESANIFRRILEAKNASCKKYFAQFSASVLNIDGKLIDRYFNYVCKRVAREKCNVTLSGINICRDNGAYAVPYALKNSTNVVYLFNGVTDLLMFTVSQQTNYCSFRDYKEEHTSTVNTTYLIELFQSDDKPCLQSPFMWYHTRYISKKADLLMFKGIPINKFRRSTLGKLRKKNMFSAIQFMYKTFMFIYKYDRKYPDLKEISKKYNLQNIRP